MIRARRRAQWIRWSSFVTIAWLLLLMFPLICIANERAGRAVFTMQPEIAADDAAKGRFHLDGKTRLVPPEVVSTRRGTAVIRVVAGGPMNTYPCHFKFWPGPPVVSFNVGLSWHKDGEGKESQTILDCEPTVVLRQDYTSNAMESLKPEKPLTFSRGTELHLVWTWSGIQHRLYCNGTLVRAYVASSPFPGKFTGELRALSDMSEEVLRVNPIRELTLYNFAFAPDDVKRDMTRKGAEPLTSDGPQPASVAAQWGPGESKVYAASDAGTATSKAARCRFIVIKGEGEALATAEVASADGFAEQLIVVPKLDEGTYHVRAEWLEASNQTVASAESERWKRPPCEWIGNTIGLSDRVQPPWTPVKESGGDLEVWGRRYVFANGFGLPQQIVSQGREQLAEPVKLTLVQDGRKVALQTVARTVTSARPHEGAWSGSAEGGGVRVEVSGTLAYDGMALVRLRLSPKEAGKPVPLEGITLDTRMPKERALFLNTSTDQGYWWYPFKGRIPEATGLVLDNLKQRPGRTNFLFYALFTDHDTGLEWFADNLAGWQVDESKPAQEISREADGSVLLRCHLANQPFVLDKPIEITFGYDATPVKPLPEDWRLNYCHHHIIPELDLYRGMWWLWEHESYKQFRPSVFSTEPVDLAGFASVMREKGRPLMVPFTNQHVLVPSGPDTLPGRGWDWFQTLLGAEAENTGWDSVPSRGARDCWAYHFDRFLRDGGVDGIYMDEANTATIGSSLLSGAGWVKPDGTHGFGHNTLGMRAQFQRLRQVFLDQGKRPLIWIPVYGKIIPHAHAFVDIVSEGESFMFEKPEDPDFIDAWCTKEGGEIGEWLLSQGPAQKFGFSTLFLDYHKFYNDPRYLRSLRAMYGLLALLDITSVNPQHAWFFKVKQQFGMLASQTSFHRYFEQKEIVSSDPRVKVSYYRRQGRVLAIITNLGPKDARTAVKFDVGNLGLALDRTKPFLVDASREEPFCAEPAQLPLTWQNGSEVTLDVPRHDFRLLWLESAR